MQNLILPLTLSINIDNGDLRKFLCLRTAVFLLSVCFVFIIGSYHKQPNHAILKELKKTVQNFHSIIHGCVSGFLAWWPLPTPPDLVCNFWKQLLGWFQKGSNLCWWKVQHTAWQWSLSKWFRILLWGIVNFPATALGRSCTTDRSSCEALWLCHKTDLPLKASHLSFSFLKYTAVFHSCFEVPRSLAVLVLLYQNTTLCAFVYSETFPSESASDHQCGTALGLRCLRRFPCLAPRQGTQGHKVKPYFCFKIPLKIGEP